MTIDYNFDKNDLIEYYTWLSDNNRKANIISLTVKIVFGLIAVVLIVLSLALTNAFYFIVGVSLIILVFQKKETKSFFVKKLNKLDEQGKLNHLFGRISMTIGDGKLLIKNNVQETSVQGIAITSLDIKGNSIVIEFGINYLLILLRNLKTDLERDLLLESLKSITSSVKL